MLGEALSDALADAAAASRYDRMLGFEQMVAKDARHRRHCIISAVVEAAA
jgi:hypothetical protein